MFLFFILNKIYFLTFEFDFIVVEDYVGLCFVIKLFSLMDVCKVKFIDVLQILDQFELFK